MSNCRAGEDISVSLQLRTGWVEEGGERVLKGAEPSVLCPRSWLREPAGGMGLYRLGTRTRTTAVKQGKSVHGGGLSQGQNPGCDTEP